MFKKTISITLCLIMLLNHCSALYSIDDLLANSYEHGSNINGYSIRTIAQEKPVINEKKSINDLQHQLKEENIQLKKELSREREKNKTSFCELTGAVFIAGVLLLIIFYPGKKSTNN